MDITCITEPYFTDLSVTNFPPRFGIVDITERPKAAIVITNRQLNYTILYCNKDINVISITYNRDNYIVINIYSPPSGDFNDIVDLLEHYLNFYQ